MPQAAAVRKILRNSEVVDTARDSDTIRLWENYRDQALLWRSIALIQVPSTVIALLFAVFMYLGSNPVINVPQRPLPGVYKASEIPDPIFIEAATEFINLIATYQPAVARRQFNKAREFLQEPFLSKFETELIAEELKAIESTARTQLFFADPTKETLVERSGPDVRVSIVGDRLKIVAGKQLPMQQTLYQIIMTTVPKNALNPYGIVIKGLAAQDIEYK
jgi:hypothetical protein